MNFLKNNISDDDSKAKELSSRVKILVWVMTTGENHETRAYAVKDTWGKHADKLLFMSDKDDKYDFLCKLKLSLYYTNDE